MELELLSMLYDLQNFIKGYSIRGLNICVIAIKGGFALNFLMEGLLKIAKHALTF